MRCKKKRFADSGCSEKLEEMAPLIQGIVAVLLFFVCIYDHYVCMHMIASIYVEACASSGAGSQMFAYVHMHFRTVMFCM